MIGIGDQANELEPPARPCRGERAHREIPVAPALPSDHYAQPEREWPCVDSTGRGREEHAFVLVRGNGLRCLWCDTPEPRA